MKDPANREIMSRLYRIIERYEDTPKIVYLEDGEKYFADVLNDVKQIFDDFPESEFAKELALGLYAALNQRFEKKNDLPLKAKEVEAQQITFENC